MMGRSIGVDIIQELRGLITGEVLSGERLDRHTAYHVGGEAEIFVRAADSDEAGRVYRLARRAGVPITILGGGTNVVAPDEGIAGIVLKLKHPGARIRFLGRGGVWADAGVDVVDLARTAARKGFRGLTAIAGVPGTVGGAVIMNAKVVEEETAALLRRVAVLTGSGMRRVFQRRELAFDYRTSIFQRTDWLILGAEFALTPGDPRASVSEVEAEWNRWRASFPLDPPNAGSVFKRPPGDYAGRLIEEAGCKGLRFGGAEVSARHANFIYNTGGASARDILSLIAEIRRRVFEKTGVYLELEQIPLRSNR